MEGALPVEAVIPALLSALEERGVAVLQAPPGAGKTTRVPLALLGRVGGRILLLEPRRLAARAAAERMAGTMGEAVGGTVGYRMRGESRVGPATRIEVLTEGILTRMVQEAPDLPGVGAVIFDEFHERSLQADLGLGLCLEARGALRPDLWLLAMSATLDAAPVAALMGDAPVVTAEGRAFPVEIRWLDRPLGERRLEAAVAGAVREVLAEAEGDVLAFLPGEGEIRRTEALLGDLRGVAVRPLFGAAPAAVQRAALAPGGGRKVVLATAIAETSLTIPGVRAVVDGGRARRARFDPASGMSRLVTERVTRAEAAQRAGRAGREGPGLCLRLWTRGEEGALVPFAPPEILSADLAPLALDLALWGGEPPLLTPPPAGALAQARALLTDLGALDAGGRITGHGREMARLGVHPRLAHMLLRAGAEAAGLAAILSEGERAPPGSADLTPLLRGAVRPEARERLGRERARLARLVPRRGEAMEPGAMAALAYPDRVGLRREGEAARFLLSGGRGAVVAAGDPLGAGRLIVATDLEGGGEEARVRAGLPLSEAGLREVLGERVREVAEAVWSAREGRVRARRQERLGALVLADRPWEDAPEEVVAAAMLDGVRQAGLRLDGAAGRLRARVRLAREAGHDLPDLEEEALLEAAEEWLLPWLGGVRSLEAFRRLDLLPALEARLGPEGMRRLERVAPAHWVTPLGRRVPVDYEGGEPAVEVRVQEAFGLREHPVASGRPLRIALLSPAGRPVAVTTDLPGFWRGGYAEVRKEMRGRYPRHPWPENPEEAAPTARAKPRG
ncbi:ATP-dependent helicase HrpB [Rubellimicrobium sp. CFH 75288]|uniref:ATP-dependent helicase HrpB n=1 Tax=Rubellimicrobium sp. CFH 75288 TaxID=2697034 RepID=UPI0014134B40|nr:ATP-dependent helicase HrpB [Rubellimicrobium sp. CFH 75288]NAZ37212.1 ATP-dependent helicase HrpB [Rubellimicrobium sp. CFH 75288]